MPDLVSLNLEYIILRIYELLFGGGIDVSSLPQQLIGWLHILSWVGILLALLFLILLVSVRLRLARVEEAGWAQREEAEIHATGKPIVKNPRWTHVLTLVNSSHASDWRSAILEADIMLFAMLNEKGFAGESVGEQLRSASPSHFTSLDLAWDAHRVRNEIAHAGEAYPLTEREAQATIDLYRRVFEEFDYI